MPLTLSAVKPPVAQVVVPAPARTVQFRVLRDGAVTTTVKRVRVVRSWDTGSQLEIGEPTVDGELTRALSIPTQLLVDQGEWAVLAIDDASPRLTFSQYLELSAGGVFTLNITSGSGGDVTDPALVDASVRVDRLPAVREVVVIERPATGEWRIAGRGQTDADGLANIDLAVTGGRVFAMAVDDYGVPFSPGLVVTVGQRIRPSVFAGVLYEITEAGTLPATEPAWWPITVEDSRELGTGRAIARRYYRPLAHGPFPVELVDD